VTKTIPVTTLETQTLWTTENIIQQQKILVTERIEQTVSGLPSAKFANEFSAPVTASASMSLRMPPSLASPAHHRQTAKSAFEPVGT
jgi:hypothetical protein